MGGAGTIRLEHARWASAFSVSQGSTRSFFNHWPWTWLTTVMALLYAILMPGKGPCRATAPNTQARVGTMLGDIGSCWTLITGKHLASGTVNMAVCANEIWDLRLWLSCGGAEESKQEEGARDHHGSDSACDAAAGGEGAGAAPGGPHG
jgi:hypothetical protein